MHESDLKARRPRFLLAGDRAIAVAALDFFIERGDIPAVLCISDRPSASHAGELKASFTEAGGQSIVVASELRDPSTSAHLRALELDFGVSVHFPELVPREVFAASRLGWLNVHPAYLPYNRGWHTPTWALLDGTPAGATIHMMTEAVDAGPILARKQVHPKPEDTAHTLYQRLLDAELDLLVDAWPDIAAGVWNLTANPIEDGSVHSKSDLERSGVQRLELDNSTQVGDLIDRLRALTTNDPTESAFFEKEGVRYRVQIDIQPVER